MKLIIGLGNPGKEYEHTRHNFGFMVVDQIAKDHNINLVDKPKFHALVAEFSQDGDKVLLVKPQTFYNLVGQSVRAIRDFYKLTNADILVVHDDIDLPIGTLRTRFDGSDAGNNGIKSLNEHLGPDYARLRIGSGNEHARENSVGHVLSRPNEEESKKLSELDQDIKSIINDFLVNQFDSKSVRK